MKDIHSNKTYSNLMHALLSSLDRKSFDDIKVSDICKIAGIHRTTFYSYFSDKYELLDACINDMMIEFSDEIAKDIYNSEKDFYSIVIMKLLTYIYSNRSFCKNLLFRNGQSLLDALQTSLSSAISEMIAENSLYDNIPADVVSQFYSGAIMSTISWWIKNDCFIPKEKLCNYLVNILRKA